MQLKDRILHFLAHQRLGLFSFLVLFIAGSIYCLQFTRIDNSLNVWFVEDDPALISYKSYLRTFGNDEVVITMIEGTAPVYKKDELEALAKITTQLQEIEGITSVWSLTHIPFVHRRKLTNFNVLLQDSISQDSLVTIFNSIREISSVQRLMGENDSIVILFSWLDTIPDIDNERGRILGTINSTVKINTNGSIHHGGIGVIYEALNKETINESSLFILASYLIVILLIALVTRRIFWTVLAVGIVTMAQLGLFASMALLNKPVNMVTMALPPLIMVIGVANIMHISIHTSAQGTTKMGALIALSLIITPLLFNTLTTAGGFLSLTTASMAITRNYGWFAALGVILVFIMVIIFTLLFVKKIPISVKRKTVKPWLGSLAQKVMMFSVKNRIYVLSTATIISIIFVWGILKISVDTNTIEFLPAKHKVRKSNNRIEELYGGFMPLEFVIALNKDAKADTSFFNKLEDLQTSIEKDENIDATFSTSNILNDMHIMTGLPKKFLIGFLERSRSDKTSTQEAMQSMHLTYQEGNTYRLSVMGPACSAKTLITKAVYIEEEGNRVLDGHATVKMSGYLPLYSQITETLLQDQVRSFTIALLVILVLTGLVLRSFKYSLLAIPSNLLPVLFILGFMGFTKISLNIATVTIAAAVLGIIVDDTIHILYHLKRYLKEGLSVEKALSQVGEKTGRAVVLTSITLCAGFGIIAMAGIKSISHTGLLIAMAIIFALIADLVVLPAVMSFIKR